jgi:hypothetical protein
MARAPVVEPDNDVETPPATRRPVRVLVADDHPAMRGALARLVREHE